jgi:8-oxo-dGTP diphosphatase
LTDHSLTRPILGVGAIVIRDGSALLVRRGRPPRKGSWSLPGGRVELGERLEEALAREVLEETGIRVAVGSLSGLYEYIERDEDDRVVHHYVVADYRCRFLEGEPQASSDVDEARFVPTSELQSYALNDEALRMIREALEDRK